VVLGEHAFGQDQTYPADVSFHGFPTPNAEYACDILIMNPPQKRKGIESQDADFVCNKLKHWWQSTKVDKDAFFMLPTSKEIDQYICPYMKVGVKLQ
jgi:hypothetical protein